MKKIGRLSKVIGVALLLVLIVLAALTYWHPGVRTTKGTTANQHRKVVRVVALGDSLTEGVGDPQKDEQGGYTGRLKTMIRQKDHVKVVMHNYGKSGDRSDQIEARLVKSSSMQHQLRRTQAVVMTVGGNDLLQTLTKNVTINQQSRLNTQLNSAETTYQQKLKHLLDTVRHYNPSAPIYLYSIYNPIYVYFADVEQVTNAVDEWNDATEQTAGKFKQLYMVDINRALSVGQFKSVTQQAKLKRTAQKANDGKLSAQSFQKQILASNSSDELNDYLSPVDHFHPNAKGYRLMTDYVFKQMQAHQQWLMK
ncbi:lysophospholipase L1 related esterase [Levilactobacillus paucivorans]|uniref:Lysophospholipase L1 related esterase n=1 Tax=Levilactobacillus paucivorans TaxID=616990 RepID=A0A0R2LIU3_9LACO|nr:GDSL-type esterase/lipase family protein [Levilactobacillus paucivorans]KRO01711.1 lysophospholipase L1 related esterase [Levilactobacillus paucivorans]